MTLHVESSDTVTVLRMDDGENRFNPTTLDAWHGALDELERAEGARAVVLTGTGKFFSNGLDLEWMGQAAEGEPQAMVGRVQELFARLLLAPFASVAAINGHWFAGGAMFAMACDERVARGDRGWFCLPEVDLGMPFTEGMAALLRARLTPQAAHRTMTGGVRLTGLEALTLAICDEVAAEADVLPRAIERAAALAPKAGPMHAHIKSTLYAPVAEALRRPIG